MAARRVTEQLERTEAHFREMQGFVEGDGSGASNEEAPGRIPEGRGRETLLGHMRVLATDLAVLRDHVRVLEGAARATSPAAAAIVGASPPAPASLGARGVDDRRPPHVDSLVGSKRVRDAWEVDARGKRDTSQASGGESASVPRLTTRTNPFTPFLTAANRRIETPREQLEACLARMRSKWDGESDETFQLWCDGGARGNPGVSGAGATLRTGSGEPIADVALYLGPRSTNNEAEYLGVLIGLHAAKKLGIERLQVYLDSMLLVNQIQGKWRVKANNLKPLHAETCQLARGMERASFRHVRREKNKYADALANWAMDHRASVFSVSPFPHKDFSGLHFS